MTDLHQQSVLTSLDRPVPVDQARRSPLRRVVARLRAGVASRVLVLLYHRIGSNKDDPHRLAVSPARFEEQVRAAKAFGPVLSLSQLTQMLKGRRLPRRATVITFDDGYADNLYLAKPILERHAAPATVFVTTGTIGRKREFWWDELQRWVLGSSDLPASITVDHAGQRYSWRTGSETERKCTHDQLHALFWNLRHEQREQALDQIVDQCAGKPDVVRANRRAMTDDEVVKLADGGLIEVGAHTHTHPNLAAHPREVQDDEIRTSRQRIEALLGRPPESFAYPFGMHTQVTVDLVREAGFSQACVCMDHAVRYQSESHRLTRVELGDLDGDKFSKRVRAAVSW